MFKITFSLLAMCLLQYGKSKALRDCLNFKFISSCFRFGFIHTCTCVHEYTFMKTFLCVYACAQVLGNNKVIRVELNTENNLISLTSFKVPINALTVPININTVQER